MKYGRSAANGSQVSRIGAHVPRRAPMSSRTSRDLPIPGSPRISTHAPRSFTARWKAVGERLEFGVATDERQHSSSASRSRPSIAPTDGGRVLGMPLALHEERLERAGLERRGRVLERGLAGHQLARRRPWP